MLSLSITLISATLLMLSTTNSASAASLSISPTSVALSAKKHSAALSLKNDGDQTKIIQTELLSWTQQDGENFYTPNRDVLVNPPIATLQAGQTQIIRIGLNANVDKTQELAYRLYITELAPPPSDDEQGLQLTLRLGLAVFVAPLGKVIGKQAWKATRNAEGNLILSMSNIGNRHTLLTSLKVLDARSGEKLTEWQPKPATLLAGQSRQITLFMAPTWHGKTIRVVAGNDEGVIESIIEIQSPIEIKAVIDNAQAISKTDQTKQ